jgi:Tfp pilus assembly protein PilX
MSTPGAQRGAALVVGLIMLVLITLTVVAAFSLSNGNLKAVGNIQVRNEAVAASNRAIEEVLTSLLLPAPDGTPTLAAPVATQSNVDINNDGVVDYYVSVAPPTCVRASQVAGGTGGAAGPGGITGGGSSSGSGLSGVSNQYTAVWDITTSVADASNNGATTTVREGVRVLINQAQYDAFCH